MPQNRFDTLVDELAEANNFTGITTNHLTIEYTKSSTAHHAICKKTNNHTNRTNCVIKGTCKCNPAEDSITCYCTNNNITENTQLSELLPMPIPNGLITAEKHHNIPTIRTSALSAEIMLSLSPNITSIAQNIQNFNCRILHNLVGCYNCIKGAVATIFCESDLPQATAQIICGLQQFTVTCTNYGKYKHILLFFNKARINEQCQAHCGTHTTIFQLQGTLNYINTIRPLWHYMRLWNNANATDSSSNIDIALPDFSHFIHTCKQFLLYSLTILTILLSALMISYTLFCSHPSHSSKRTSTFNNIISVIPPLRILLTLLTLIRCFPSHNPTRPHSDTPSRVISFRQALKGGRTRGCRSTARCQKLVNISLFPRSPKHL
ncbi:hypothetical protein COOONC_01085 [Cooperia oncophora]